MKRSEISPSSFNYKKNTEKGLNGLIKKLNFIGIEVQHQKLSAKTLRKSLKNISDQIVSLSLSKPKFTEEAQYISGKNKLFQNSKQNLEKKSLENMIDLIDEKNENQLNVITEEVMKSKSIKKAFKAKKREFGFRKLKTQNDIKDFDSYAEMVDSQKSKILPKVLYGSQNKNFVRDDYSDRKFERSSTLKPVSSRLFTSSLSPGISRVGSPFVQGNFDLMKDYYKTLQEGERENEVAKFKLSRLLSLRNIFKLDS